MKFVLVAVALALPHSTQKTTHSMEKRDRSMGVLHQLHLGKRDEISDLVQDILKAAH
jgi:hypothetical protein